MQELDTIGLPVVIPPRLSKVVTYLEAFFTNASATKLCSELIERQIDKLIGYIDRCAEPSEWAVSGLVDAINVMYAVLSTREDSTLNDPAKAEIEQLRQKVLETNDLSEKHRIFYENQINALVLEKVKLQSNQLQVSKGDVVLELQKQLDTTHAKNTKLFTEVEELKEKHKTLVKRMDSNHQRELENAEKDFDRRKKNLQADIQKQRGSKEVAIRDLKAEMVRKEKEARNAKTEKLENRLANSSAELNNLKEAKGSLNQELREARAVIAQNKADLDKLASDYQQDLRSQKKRSTLKSMRLLLCAISKTNDAKEQIVHERDLRFEAYADREKMRTQLSLNVAAMDRNRRLLKELSAEHSQEVAELKHQNSRLHDEIVCIGSIQSDDSGNPSPEPESETITTPSPDSITEDEFVEAEAGNTDKGHDEAEDSDVGSEGHREAEDSGMGSDDGEQVEDSGVGISSPEDSTEAPVAAEDTVVEGNDDSTEGIEESGGIYEDTYLAVDAEDVNMDAEVGANDGSEEIAAGEDMQME